MTYDRAPNAVDISSNTDIGASELIWLFNVTFNDISLIYVTAHRCAGGMKRKLGLRSRSQRHRHFVGFFNVPVQAPTRGHPFYMVIPRNRPHLVAFYDTLGIRRTLSRLNPRVSTGDTDTGILAFLLQVFLRAVKLMVGWV